MGIFQALSRTAAKAVGLDVDYRERYQEAHPEDPKCQMCGKQLLWASKGEDGVTIDHIWPQKLAIKFPVLAKPLIVLLIYNLCVENAIHGSGMLLAWLILSNP